MLSLKESGCLELACGRKLVVKERICKGRARKRADAIYESELFSQESVLGLQEGTELGKSHLSQKPEGRLGIYTSFLAASAPSVPGERRGSQHLTCRRVPEGGGG